jgi:hypothetical protein
MPRGGVWPRVHAVQDLDFMRGAAAYRVHTWSPMTKFIKSALLVGALVGSTAVVSFADAPKTADKSGSGAGSATAGSADAGSGSAKSKTTTKKTTAPAKGAGSASK